MTAQTDDKNQKPDPLDNFAEPDFEKLRCGIDEKLIFMFFNYFSRFEHALKRQNFIKLDKQQYVVGVNWKDYSDTVSLSLPSGSKKADAAISYICNNTVNRQKSDGTWEVQPKIYPENFSKALLQIPMIRNNLFHGSKYFKPDPNRDNDLLVHAITLIKVCLDRDSNLYHEFLTTGQ